VHRIVAYFDATPEEAEAVHERIADLLCEHARASEAPDAGYVVTLGPFEQPEDDEEFARLVADGAVKFLFGPEELFDCDGFERA